MQLLIHKHVSFRKVQILFVMYSTKQVSIKIAAVVKCSLSRSEYSFRAALPITGILPCRS